MLRSRLGVRTREDVRGGDRTGDCSGDRGARPGARPGMAMPGCALTGVRPCENVRAPAATGERGGN